MSECAAQGLLFVVKILPIMDAASWNQLSLKSGKVGTERERHRLPEPSVHAPLPNRTCTREWRPAPTAHRHSGLNGTQRMRARVARWRLDGKSSIWMVSYIEAATDYPIWAALCAWHIGCMSRGARTRRNSMVTKTCNQTLGRHSVQCEQRHLEDKI